MTPRTLLGLALLALLATNAVAENKQQEATNLISQAIESADIRCTGAPPFRLKAKLYELGPGSSDAGTFTETWISRERWRREFEFGSFKRTQVGVGETKWLLDSSDHPPHGATLDRAIDVRTLTPAQDLKVKKIYTKDLLGVQTTCVRLESDLQMEVFCIDLKQTLIILHESLSPHVPQSHVSFIYSDYHKFGERFFPRSVQVIKENQVPIEIKISDLSVEASTDPALFAPLSGGVELANCLINEMKPPSVDVPIDPVFPNGQHVDTALVVLSLIVGSDGKPYRIRVTASAGKAFDTEALNAVGRWQFRPAQCHAHSVPAEINVDVTFRR
jgi:TonB family protein